MEDSDRIFIDSLVSEKATENYIKEYLQASFENGGIISLRNAMDVQFAYYFLDEQEPSQMFKFADGLAFELSEKFNAKEKYKNLDYGKIDEMINEIESESEQKKKILSEPYDLKNDPLPKMEERADAQAYLDFAKYHLWALYELKREKAQNPKQRDKAVDSLLGNNEFKKILKNAIKAGFVENDGDVYKWKGKKNELAYFAEIVSYKLKLTNRQNSDGRYQTNWKLFEDLFNVEKLRLTASEWRNKTRSFPKREENIDNLLN